MNQINDLNMEQNEKWVARNPQNRKHEEIDPLLAELPAGSYALRLSWSNECQSYVTTAGSLHRMTTTGLVMETE